MEKIIKRYCMLDNNNWQIRYNYHHLEERTKLATDRKMKGSEIIKNIVISVQKLSVYSCKSRAINLLFHESNMGEDLLMRKSLSSFSFVLRTNKTQDDKVKTLHTILYAVMPSIFPQHFEIYKKSGQQYIRQKNYYIQPQILRSIQLLLSQYCKRKEDILDDVENLSNLVKPGSSEKNLFRFFGTISRCDIADKHNIKLDFLQCILESVRKEDKIQIEFAEYIILNIFKNMNKEDKEAIACSGKNNTVYNINTVYNMLYNINTVYNMRMIMKKFIILGTNTALKRLLKDKYFKPSFPQGCKLLSFAVKSKNAKAAEVLCEAGFSPNYPICSPAIDSAGSNISPEMTALFKKYWFCTSNYLSTISLCFKLAFTVLSALLFYKDSMLFSPDNHYKRPDKASPSILSLFSPDNHYKSIDKNLKYILKHILKYIIHFWILQSTAYYYIDSTIYLSTISLCFKLAFTVLSALLFYKDSMLFSPDYNYEEIDKKPDYISEHIIPFCILQEAAYYYIDSITYIIPDSMSWIMRLVGKYYNDASEMIGINRSINTYCNAIGEPKAERN